MISGLVRARPPQESRLSRAFLSHELRLVLRGHRVQVTTTQCSREHPTDNAQAALLDPLPRGTGVSSARRAQEAHHGHTKPEAWTGCVHLTAPLPRTVGPKWGRAPQGRAPAGMVAGGCQGGRAAREPQGQVLPRPGPLHGALSLSALLPAQTLPPAQTLQWPSGGSHGDPHCRARVSISQACAHPSHETQKQCSQAGRGPSTDRETEADSSAHRRQQDSSSPWTLHFLKPS